MDLSESSINTFYLNNYVQDNDAICYVIKRVTGPTDSNGKYWGIMLPKAQNGTYATVPAGTEKLLKDIQPMPLSHYWVNRFNFREVDNGKHSFESQAFPRLQIQLKSHWIARLDDQELNVRILYVHQLQNLYNILAGDDLK